MQKILSTLPMFMLKIKPALTPSLPAGQRPRTLAVVGSGRLTAINALYTYSL
jgi:hypothetical protein